MVEQFLAEGLFPNSYSGPARTPGLFTKGNLAYDKSYDGSDGRVPIETTLNEISDFDGGHDELLDPVDVVHEHLPLEFRILRYVLFLSRIERPDRCFYLQHVFHSATVICEF